MPITLEQVRAVLERDEPNYDAAARFGADAIPHLEELVADPDVGIASKAASLAGAIGGDAASRVLERAVENKDARVRTAAAHAAGRLPPGVASGILARFVRDSDIGVQKVALNATPAHSTPALQQTIDDLSKHGASPEIRALSQEVLKKLRR